LFLHTFDNIIPCQLFERLTSTYMYSSGYFRRYASNNTFLWGLHCIDICEAFANLF